jgi:hypothetical protein
MGKSRRNEMGSRPNFRSARDAQPAPQTGGPATGKKPKIHLQTPLKEKNLQRTISYFIFY